MKCGDLIWRRYPEGFRGGPGWICWNVAGLLLAFLMFSLSAGAVDSQGFTAGEFDAESLKLRTALHYDPLVEQSLKSLVRLYSDAKRTDELIGLYQAHVAKYPDDVGAKTVLLRILKSLERPEFDEQITAAVQQHPDYAALQYLLFQFLDGKGDPRAPEVLSRAIDLEEKPGRKSEWLNQLLQISEDEPSRGLAVAHLKRLLDQEKQTGESFLKLAELMQRYLYWDLSLKALAKAVEAGVDPETGLQIEILSARAEAALGEKKLAGKRLDAVLERLAPDHWMRGEVIRLRVNVFASDAERDAMLEKMKSAYDAAPNSESVILDYAELLVAVDRREEAADLLLDGAARLPESKILEERVLNLLELLSDNVRLEKFLAGKLESDPSRLDLRYQLVKVRYALGKPLDADQDFQAVLAALPESVAGKRMLDLARYLRSFKQLAPAAKYFREFLKSNANRLDVIRELTEVYLEQKNRRAANQLLARVSVKDAKVENVLDLVQFVIDERLFPQAQRLLSERLADDPNQFELGVLYFQVLAEMGDRSGAERWIDQIRPHADTPARYARWLAAGLQAHASSETVDRFFDSELNRFTFSDSNWTPDRVEKFLILCEQGEKRNLKGRVSLAIQNRLAGSKLDVSASVRLRKLLVRSYEDDPSRLQEMEEQLQLLAREDPDEAPQYDLQRALIYHRSNREDLAEEMIRNVDLSKVKSVRLLRETVPVILDFGDETRAERVLAAITELDPRDLHSWEERLSLLAAMGDEKEFRNVVSSLLQDFDEVKLSDSSREALTLQRLDSFWRSEARLLSAADTGNEEDALALLDVVDREAQTPDRLWTQWTRTFLLKRLGRTRESEEAGARLEALLKSGKSGELSFPDGLSIASSSARDVALMDDFHGDQPETEEIPLLAGPTMGWAFEVEAGAKILRFQAVSGSVLVLDDRGSVYRISTRTGKLIWKENLGISEQVVSVEPGITSSREPDTLVFQNQIDPVPDSRITEPDSRSVARKVRPFVADDRSFYLTFGPEIRAYSINQCALLWRSRLPGGSATEAPISAGSAVPEINLAMGKGNKNGILAVSDPVTGRVGAIDRETGKMLWSKTLLRTREPADKGVLHLFSLNCGLSISGNQIFVFGRAPAVLNLHTGEEIWRFGNGQVSTFPVVLRKDRTESVDGSPDLPGILDTANKSEAWKHGNRGWPPQKRVLLVDYLTQADAGGDRAVSFLKYPFSLVAPAVDWARSRSVNGILADASLGDGYLWLMGNGGVRRVSLSLPIASGYFPVKGSFLGQTENHGWFLDAGKLNHADFRRNRSIGISLSNLGRSEDLRGVLHGDQVVVSGERGLEIFHAETGRPVAAWGWPEELIDHLKKRGATGQSASQVETEFVWQGVIRKGEMNQVAYLYPVLDSVQGSDYFTVFKQRILVALREAGKGTQDDVPGSAGETPGR